MESLEMPKKHIRKRMAPLGVTPAEQALLKPGCVGAPRRQPGWGQAVVLLDVCGQPASFPSGLQGGWGWAGQGALCHLPGSQERPEWSSGSVLEGFSSLTRGEKR